MTTLSGISKAALLSLFLVACGAPRPEPLIVRAADLGKVHRESLRQPLVVEFDEGDTLPLAFSLDGPFIKTAADAPTIPLRVVRHFYLRIDDRGLRASLDGKNFDAKPAAPGQFRIGVGSHDGKLGAEIAITTPVPAGLTATPAAPSR